MSNIAYFNGYIQIADTQSGLSTPDKLELLKAIAKLHDVEEIFDTYDCNNSGYIDVGSAEDHYYEESGCFWKFEFKDGQLYVNQGRVVFEKAEAPTDLSRYKSDPDDLPIR